MTRNTAGHVSVVKATPEHASQVLSLMRSALGWRDDDWHSALFAWKHVENPFGPSPAWVAEVDGEVVGFRTFMRWKFDSPTGTVNAVRAVDTATHEAHRGKGIFRLLTLRALEEMRDEGVDFVFNTPNDLSQPGYLRMGWEHVGRLGASVRPRSPAAIARMARARVPAELRSESAPVGVPARDLVDQDELSDLVASQPPARGLRTLRSREFLAWRYGSELMGYRAMLTGEGPDDGVAFFRVRRRGAAREAVIGDVLVPGGDARAIRHLLRRVARGSRADYTLVRTPGALGAGYVPLPGVGPILTWRGVKSDTRPPLRSWCVGLGDVELF